MDENGEPVDFAKAEKTIRDYCCAVCWGHLLMMPVKGSRDFTIECGKYGTSHSGYVKKSYASQRRSDSHGELIEARYNLAGVFGPEDNRTEADCLRDLGF